ncbi:MAG: imelysin family protein [Pseudomonadales bacterium]
MYLAKTTLLTVAVLFAGALFAEPTTLAASTNEKSVVKNYTTIAHAIYLDSLITAKALQKTIDAFINQPNANTQQAAKDAWIAARVPYQQSEVLRFGNPIVDDWEGQVNGWPLDEGLIDYVDSSYEHEMGNVGATANIIASPQLNLGDATLDLSTITPEILASLNELAGSEANVATGYHAIEFLLWGQDLNGTGTGAGQRPFSDYLVGTGCTNGNCDRRVAYLVAAIQLLVNDLENMTQQWEVQPKIGQQETPEKKANYRTRLLAQSSTEGLTKMLYGMGSLSLGELAGERMKVALEANSSEDEHDCFSDNTHFSHYYDALGIQNIYLGQYLRIDGTVVTGPSLSSLVATVNNTLDQQTRAAFATTVAAIQVMVDTAEHKDSPVKFDQMIAEGNRDGRKIVSDSIQALVAQTTLLEKVAKAIGIENLNPDSADYTL